MRNQVRRSCLLSILSGVCLACGDDREQTRAALLDTTFLSAGEVSLRPDSNVARDSAVGRTFLDAPRRSGLGLTEDDDDDDDDRVEQTGRGGRDKPKRGKQRGRGHRD